MINQNDIQFDYFSKNFHRFEEDFYKYSLLDIPLTFITDDILHVMTSNQRSYFRLNQQKAKDRRDHYFLFEMKMVENTRSYKYIGHQYTLKA
jgi:hypothetical protein